MVFVKISLVLLTPNVLIVQWLNIWVKFMLFFTISMSYCLRPISLLKSSIKGQFFMLLALHGLLDDYSHVRDWILGSPVVPNFTSICSTLLLVLVKPTTNIPAFVDDSFS